MKKFCISMSLLILMAVPMVSNANAETDTSEMLRSLMQQVERLQKTVDALLKEQDQKPSKERRGNERKRNPKEFSDKKIDTEKSTPSQSPIFHRYRRHGLPSVQA